MRSRVITTSLVATTLVVLLLLSAAATSGAAQGPVYQPPQSYYLALGDSMAYGFQPTKANVPPSAVKSGYVDLLAERFRKLSPQLEVVNYGCPGESTVTFVKDGCDWIKHGGKLHDPFRGAQMTAALAFLRAHGGKVSPITVTLRGNDVFPLSARGTHAQSTIASFARRFSSILRQLRAAAPSAEIIVSGAWTVEADKLATVGPLYRSVDAAIRRAAAASRARVADVAAALEGTGSVKARQARLCSLTFYCKQATQGDPHPTDAGYRAMAGAFYAASGYKG
jgi:lysophospholipase L1-like esterase